MSVLNKARPAILRPEESHFLWKEGPWQVCPQIEAPRSPFSHRKVSVDYKESEKETIIMKSIKGLESRVYILYTGLKTNTKRNHGKRTHRFDFSAERQVGEAIERIGPVSGPQQAG